MIVIEEKEYFLIISRATAKKVCGDNRLPKSGYERIGSDEGKNYWIGQKVVNGKLVWTATETDWEMTPTGVILRSKELRSGTIRYQE